MNLPEAYVLDCSLTLSWLFEDEATPETDALFAAAADARLIVPALWHLELANCLNQAAKRKRVTESQITGFVARLLRQRLLCDDQDSIRAFDHLRPLALRHSLTVYDAAYLDLSIRKGLPLATLDSALKRAARAVEVGLVLEA